MSMAGKSIIDGNAMDIATRAVLTGHYEGIPIRNNSYSTERVSSSTTVIIDDSYQEEIDRLQEENKKLREENTRLTAECNRLSRWIDSFTRPE